MQRSKVATPSSWARTDDLLVSAFAQFSYHLDPRTSRHSEFTEVACMARSSDESSSISAQKSNPPKAHEILQSIATLYALEGRLAARQSRFG